ncbi:MAG: hypothetical protein LBI61_02330 [Puniceicoccales bacterium]|jgi:hypothetical protein|nr:hypothetical protein [Puniceicoccales bacterium]
MIPYHQETVPIVINREPMSAGLAQKTTGSSAIRSFSGKGALSAPEKSVRTAGKSIESRTAAAVERILLKMLAAENFIYKALEATPEALISYMNSWDCETMDAFIKQYDALPEPMLVKLLAAGLSCENLPKDVLLSYGFLSAAAEESPSRLANILNGESIQDVRPALRDLRPSNIKKLWDNGLSTNRVPTAKITEFFSLLRAGETERFAKEIANPINALQRMEITQSLTSRGAQTHNPYDNTNVPSLKRSGIHG